MQDFVAETGQHSAQRRKGEEPNVRKIEDSFLAVVEHAEEQAQPRGNESDVRRGDDDSGRFGERAEMLTQLEKKSLRRFDMLENVEAKDDIRMARQDRQVEQSGVEIRAEFPDLFTRKGQAAANGEVRRRRRRKAMSPAARKAVSERMRKYWAERRKGK